MNASFIRLLEWLVKRKICRRQQGKEDIGSSHGQKKSMCESHISGILRPLLQVEGSK